MEHTPLTLEELTDRVAQSLADGYPGAPTARVRDLPNARAIRWYITRGLVDPPLAMRGRQALYGERHLLQLVAIKRRQAEGRSLAEIQTELLGATGATLASIAALPAPEMPADIPLTMRAASPRRRPHLADHGAEGGSGRANRHFAHDQRDTETAPVRFWAALPESQGDGVDPEVRAVRLAPGVTLLLEEPGAAIPGGGPDADALRGAARPLLDLLARTTARPGVPSGEDAGREKGPRP